MNFLKIKRASSRLLVRYLPAVGTLLLSKVLLDSYSSEDYVTFALITSFAALVPVLDIGGGTRAVLALGAPDKISQLLLLPMLVSVLIGVGWLISGSEQILHVFLLSVPVAVWVVARGNYSFDGADRFNNRALLAYPIGFLGIFAAIRLDLNWASYACGLFVVYFLQIAGVRPRYIADVAKSFSSSIKLRQLIPTNSNMLITLLSIVAFIGAWGNVLFLKYFSNDQEVIIYDLIWRLLSVTFFAQIYLTHSLPKVVRAFDEDKDDKTIKSTYLQLMSVASSLAILQAAFVVPALPFYSAFFGFDYYWGDVAAGLFMCLVFALFIPINHICLATGRLSTLIGLSVTSALLSVVLKILLPASVQSAFLSSAFGYFGPLLVGSYLLLRGNRSSKPFSLGGEKPKCSGP